MNTPSQKAANIINHVTIVLDKSSSMGGHAQNVIKVTDSQIQYLARRSKELDQETRITVYTFSDRVQCVIYDKDVLRMPSIREYYQPQGMTNLLGASVQAITEAKEITQRYGDHSFLFYVITDGENNLSYGLESKLKEMIQNAPENFTIACMVPNQRGVAEAKKFGFPANNVEIWNANASDGYGEVETKMQKSTEAYFQARSQGIRGTKNLFSLDTSNLSAKVVSTVLDELKYGTDFQLLKVDAVAEVRPFIQKETGNYVKGCCFYELTKREEIQAAKQIIIKNKKNSKFFGGANARKLLGLPDTSVKVAPADFGDFQIFVQSTSINRKLMPNTTVVVTL